MIPEHLMTMTQRWVILCFACGIILRTILSVPPSGTTRGAKSYLRCKIARILSYRFCTSR